jgi:hypothetical protein
MVEIKRRGSNEEVIRSRYGVGNSGYPEREAVREAARPLHHTTTIYQSAHMSAEPYSSLLNQGHVRQTYGGK